MSRRVLALLLAILVVVVIFVAVFFLRPVPTERLVVTSQPIKFGVLIETTNIGTYFTIKSYPTSRVPAHAYIYTTQAALVAYINNNIVMENVPANSVLLQEDPRYCRFGAGQIAPLHSTPVPASCH